MTCPLCSISQKHVASQIVYEDAVCLAYLPSDAAAVGHIHVIPKDHIETLEQLPDSLATQLFYVASYAASAIYEGLASHGTNIICNNGAGAKGHLSLHIIPRFENDGISLTWQPKQLPPPDFEDAMKKIKDKADFIDYKGAKKEAPALQQAIQPEAVAVPQDVVSVKDAPKEIITTSDEENYMVKHLYRIP
ncbi:HIT family protein [Candidatus Woesearchaeota archaeon]|nr:HIT family protein [Candidatus Woesearchaeota archaeon]